jgi:16S rRNA (uracil1498-N3)-methyltransferase
MKRFYLSATLTPGATLTLPEPLSHRLRNVLRMQPGDPLHLFNNQGELAAATLADAKARHVVVTAMLPAPAPLTPRTLVLGVPKREAWESALRQATELGVTTIIPLKTKFSQVGKLNFARAEATLIEAAEQSERTTLPLLAPLTPLHLFLEALAHPCAWAYERMGTHAATALVPTHSVLVGPEGGFASEEVEALQRNPHIVPFSLGPTILRTDTAVVAALAHLQR